MKNTNKKTCFVPRSLLRAIRANDPEQVRSTLPPEPNPLELIEALLTENDQVGVALVAECHQEITSPDPDVVDSLRRNRRTC